MPEPVLLDVRLCPVLSAHHQPGKGGGIVFSDRTWIWIQSGFFLDPESRSRLFWAILDFFWIWIFVWIQVQIQIQTSFENPGPDPDPDFFRLPDFAFDFQAKNRIFYEK